MELRALGRLWLLCCWWCCGAGPGAGPGVTLTPTRPRSRERQEAAFREGAGKLLESEFYKDPALIEQAGRILPVYDFRVLGSLDSCTALKVHQESLNRHRYLNSLFPSENSSAVYGINQFSYLFPEEFKAIYLRSKPFTFPRYAAEVPEPISNMSLPLRFDWRDKHVVTLVRNQQACGGCWAFSVVGAVESAYAIKGEPLEDLSVQQVIDCSYNNYGCNGGSTLSALNWLNKTQVKLVRDSEYPFKAQNGLCHYFPDSHSGFSIRGYSAHDFSDQEDKMAKVLLTFGPLVGIVDAVSWQDYLGGIIQHHCSSGEANHAVIITGFDKTGSTPYWIVRNSWGSSWGVDGYAYVKMGGNICGIADSVSAVFV